MLWYGSNETCTLCREPVRFHEVLVTDKYGAYCHADCLADAKAEADAIAASDRAGLLRTGAEKEVMPRLTSTVTAMLLTGGLTGHRIGIAPDFARLTDLHERALKACEVAAREYDRVGDTIEALRACAVIGGESIAKQPKPRWTHLRTENTHLPWAVLWDGNEIARFERESDAIAYAASKNAEGGAA